MKTLNRLILVIILLTGWACQDDTTNEIQLSTETKDVVVSIREKQFDETEITFVLNGEIAGQTENSSYFYIGKMPVVSTFVIESSDKSAQFEYDIYIKSGPSDPVTSVFEGEEYYLHNDRAGYTSPIVDQGQIVNVNLER